MSETQIQTIQSDHYSCENEFKIGGRGSVNLAEQVIDNSVFKIMLKDLVEEMCAKAQKDQSGGKQNEEKFVELENLIEEIGDQLLVVATTQASKQIKQSEKFLTQLYEHKVRELEDRFEELMDKKIKQVQERMQKIQILQQKYSSEPIALSPIRVPFKDKHLSQANEQLHKRLELKEKILNSTLIQQTRPSLNLDGVSSSLLSDSFSGDATIDRLSQKIKQIEQNMKGQFKIITQKITAVRTQTQTDIKQAEVDIKQQLNNGFEGIWNVISNLEKRMVI